MDQQYQTWQRLLHLPVLMLCILLAGGRYSNTFAAEYQAETVFSTDGIVWSFAFLSPDELLVTLRQGKLLHVNLTDSSQEELALNLDIAAIGQGGLLDVHLQKHNGKDFVYLTYSTKYRGKLTTALARGIWDGKHISELETIFIADTKGNSGRHFGSRLQFQDGHIYMTIGDRADRDYAQNLSSHNGKILRLTMDGKPAAGNPFAGMPDALPEIWSYGHRNPQGIDLDSATGALYSAEFGPRGGDELNLIEPGNNYGWPVINYGREYWGPKFDTHHPGMEQPVAYWTPSISPSGMAFYQGDKIPQWRGNLFLACLNTPQLRRLVLEDNQVTLQEELFADLGERIRHVRSGLDGYLYFSTDSGKIFKVTS